MATARKTKTPKPNPIHVIVCMEASSTMYYGEIDEVPTSTGPITLRNARHIAYWDLGRDEHNTGIGELARTGPGPEGKIGPAVISYTMMKPAGMFVCSDVAVLRFAAQGWGKVRV